MNTSPEAAEAQAELAAEAAHRTAMMDASVACQRAEAARLTALGFLLNAIGLAIVVATLLGLAWTVWGMFL